MNQLRGTLKGVVTALGTPLDRNEDLHEKGMRKQIRMQLAAGVDGLLVLGSMGCMQMLKDEVFVEALEVAVDEVRGAVPVIVGCGDTSTERTLARIRLSENYPLAGVALIPPFIFRFSQAELHEYFTGVASRTSLPVYPYDNPALTGHSLEHELVRKLAEHSNIVGLKASGDFLTFRQSAEHFRDSDFCRSLRSHHLLRSGSATGSQGNHRGALRTGAGVRCRDLPELPGGRPGRVRRGPEEAAPIEGGRGVRLGIRRFHVGHEPQGRPGELHSPALRSADTGGKRAGRERLAGPGPSQVGDSSRPAPDCGP